MTHRHDLPPGLGPLTSLTHTHDGHTHTHVSGQVPDGPPQRLHLHGVVLPEGDERDLWLHDGVISLEPIADAITVATSGWIMPGLVDAHCHVGLESHGAVSEERAEEHALTDREVGTLLIRDAGSPLDTRFLQGREDLPKIIRAGRHIARPKRYSRNFAEEVEPDQLVDEVVTQAERGDGWVKIVGDWIDRDTGDLSPLWPTDVAKEAIEAAHEHGARVTAHCFDERSVTELVDAGIDGIEHGTGLDDDTIAAMAERQVSLVPTMVNLENFPQFAAAGEAKFPTYAAHIMALYERRFETMGKAVDAGVPVYAGTDAGGVHGHGLIAGEIELLAKVGGNEFALGAASWNARAWLGHAGIEEGAPADIVVFAEDPRVTISVVREPVLIILNGRVVGGSAAN